MEFRVPFSYKVNPEDHRGENAPKNFQGMIMDDEKWLVCPYDRNHRVLRSGRQFSHLINCRNVYMKMKQQNNEEMDIGICPYNWKHHIPLAEMEAHKELCDDQYTVFTYLQMYNEKMATVKMCSFLKFATDDWGDDTPAASTSRASVAGAYGRAWNADDLAGQIVEKVKRNTEHGMQAFDPSVYRTVMGRPRLRPPSLASSSEGVELDHYCPSTDAAESTDSEDLRSMAEALLWFERPREPREPAGRGRGFGRGFNQPSQQAGRGRGRGVGRGFGSDTD